MQAGLLFEKGRLIKQQRSAYVAISTYGIGPSMTDHEREQLDYDMTSFAKAFDQNLTLLRTLISSSPKASLDCKKHYDLIVLYLYTKLQALMEQVREMRLFRSKRLKLRAPTASSSKIQHPSVSVVSARAALLENQSQMENPTQDLNRSENLQLSSEQMLMLEHENAALFAELDSDMNAVREAEAKLNEIAELFSLFSTKIVEQQQQIETIYDNIVTGKSNMDMALDQLRKYLKSSVSFRLNILTIFVIATPINMAIRFVQPPSKFVGRTSLINVLHLSLINAIPTLDLFHCFLMALLLHTKEDPGTSDDLLIFSTLRFDVSRYIVQFHVDYVQNHRDGLKCKLRRRRRQVDARLRNLTIDQFIAFMKIGDDYRRRGSPLRSLPVLIKCRSCLQSLMSCSLSNIHLAKLHESSGDAISDFELQAIQNMVEGGQLELAVDAIIMSSQLSLSSTQQQTLNLCIERLKSVLLYGIHKQLMLSERKSLDSVANGFPEFLSSLSLLNQLGKTTQALSAFFEFHTFIQEKILSSIWTAKTDSLTCAIKTVSCCTNGILSALQQFKQLFSDIFPLTKFTVWTTSQMTVLSAATAEFLSHCSNNEHIQAVSDLQHRLQPLAKSGFNFWFLFEKALSMNRRKKIQNRQYDAA